MPSAESQAAYEELRTPFVKRYHQLAPKAVECLRHAWERCITFGQFPQAHGCYLQTRHPMSSVVEP
jgi:transposase-like protein